MKNRWIIVLLSLCVMGVSCQKENTEQKNGDECVTGESITPTSTKEQDMQLLTKLWDDIYATSGSSNCQRANEWGIAPVGSKPCGGPWTYIAYRMEIDVDCFLRKVKYYNEQQSRYNSKYGIGSDCMVEPMPKAVKCEEGKPVFIY